MLSRTIARALIFLASAALLAGCDSSKVGRPHPAPSEKMQEYRKQFIQSMLAERVLVKWEERGGRHEVWLGPEFKPLTAKTQVFCLFTLYCYVYQAPDEAEQDYLEGESPTNVITLFDPGGKEVGAFKGGSARPLRLSAEWVGGDASAAAPSMQPVATTSPARRTEDRQDLSPEPREESPTPPEKEAAKPPQPEPAELARIKAERQAVAELRSAKITLRAAREFRYEQQRAQWRKLTEKAQQKLEALVSLYPSTAAALAAKRTLGDLEAGKEPNLDLAEVVPPDLPGSDAAAGPSSKPARSMAPLTDEDGRPIGIAPAGSKTQHVGGYYRKDGKYVAPYNRAAPGMGRRRY